MEDENPVLYDNRFVMPSGAFLQAFAHRSDEVSQVGGVKYRLHYWFPRDEHPIPATIMATATANATQARR